MTTVSWRTVQDENRAALTTPVGRVSNQPSGLLLSPGFPTTRNVYQERCSQTFWSGDFLWWAVQDSNRAGPRVAAPSSSSPLPPQAAVVAVAVPKRSFFFYPSTLRLYSSTILACGSSYEQKPPRRSEIPVPAGRLSAFTKRGKVLRGLRRWSG